MIYVPTVESAFSSGDFYQKAGVEYLAAEKVGSDYSPVRFAREVKLFRRHCQSGNVLDVGCSSGGFLYRLNQLHPRDYRVTGTDVSIGPLEYAEKRGIPVIRENFLSDSFPAETFDAITFWAVLEHVAEPRKFLKRAHQRLKPGGVCFVLVPNMNSLAVKLLGAKYRYILSEHINYFTQQTLDRLVGSLFQVVEWKQTHFNPLVIVKDARGAAKEVSRQERSQLLAKTTAYKQNPLLAPVKVMYGAAEKILATAGLADNLAVVLKKA
jgi:SAM-dependent methyltransferase